MLVQRRRRWAVVVQVLHKCFVFAKYALTSLGKRDSGDKKTVNNATAPASCTQTAIPASTSGRTNAYLTLAHRFQLWHNSGAALGHWVSCSLGWCRYTDFSPHSQFAPFFSETFRPQLILRKDVSPPPHKQERRFAPISIVQEDVSHPNHISERRFAPKPYFRKTFRTQTIFQKDVSHPNHISERCFAHKSYLGKTFRPLFIFGKDVSPPNQKNVSPPMVIIWKEVSHPFYN